MTLWNGVLVAAIICAGLKGIGYLLPARWFTHPTTLRTTDLMTVALLAALVTVQTLGGAGTLVVDARVPAVVVAALLLLLRAPFLVVVLGAAATAAGLRALGWAS